MTNLEQLQEILCTVESVEKDVKELRFGCRISQHNHCRKETIYLGDTPNEDSCMWSNLFYTYDIRNEFPYWESPSEYSDDFRGNNKHNDFKIIWNPLSLKHLMMYCNEKGIEFKIHENWDLYRTESCADDRFITQLDITKELYEQEDKVLLDIINFLKG